MGEPIDSDIETFDTIVQQAKVPILVDFWAAWCGPCRMAAPEVQKVASTMAGRAIVLIFRTIVFGSYGLCVRSGGRILIDRRQP